MTRQLFDEIIGTPPRSTVDVGAIVRRERRGRATRGAGGVLAVVLVLAAPIALLATVQESPRVTPPVAGSPGTGPATGGPAADVTFRLVADDQEAARDTAARLRAALGDALRQTVPAATWVRSGAFGPPSPDGEPPNLVGFGGGANDEEMFSGGTGVRNGGRLGGLSLAIVHFVAKSAPPCDNSEPKCAAERKLSPGEGFRKKRAAVLGCVDEPQCVQRTSTGGLAMTVRTGRAPKTGGVFHAVHVDLPDGRMLEVQVTNEHHPVGGSIAVQQPEPPLTADELAAVATAVAGRIRA